tara:strand:+ start:148 stop:447 length:300 start_codon:yes stop_codon:yes gene_type:complete
MKSNRRATINQVVMEWVNMIGGEREVDGELRVVCTRSESMRVYNDGTIYSYGLLIGEIVDGVKRVYNHTTAGGSYVSKTTSCHVGFIRPYALEIIDYVK